MGLIKHRKGAGTARSGAWRYLLFGVGVGLGLGIWSTLSVVVWERYRSNAANLGGPPVAVAPDFPSTQAPSRPAPAQSRRDASISLLDQVPAQLRDAPREWISDEIDRHAAKGYLARFSVFPPGMRVEECARPPGDDSCTALAAGTVVGVTSDTIKLDSAKAGSVVVGWKISSGKLTLNLGGRELLFRPGTKTELFKELASGGP